jgi:hypothetical protein
MGCGSAGAKGANILSVGLVNAARIRQNVVLDEFNVAPPRCFDDVVLPDDARRSLRLRDTREVGQRAVELSYCSMAHSLGGRSLSSRFAFRRRRFSTTIRFESGKVPLVQVACPTPCCNLPPSK